MQWARINEWKEYLAPFNLLYYKEEFTGFDLQPLKQEALLIGLKTETQRLFDIHHTAEDRFEKVVKRELELGAAAITALIFLIDQDGVKQ